MTSSFVYIVAYVAFVSLHSYVLYTRNAISTLKTLEWTSNQSNDNYIMDCTLADKSLNATDDASTIFSIYAKDTAYASLHLSLPTRYVC